MFKISNNHVERTWRIQNQWSGGTLFSKLAGHKTEPSRADPTAIEQVEMELTIVKEVLASASRPPAEHF